MSEPDQAPNVVPIRPMSDANHTPIFLIQPQGAGSGGDGSDSWRQSVESRLNQLHTDIGGLRSDLTTKSDRANEKMDSHLKWLLGVMATSTIGLAGLMAQGFDWFK